MERIDDVIDRVLEQSIPKGKLIRYKRNGITFWKYQKKSNVIDLNEEKKRRERERTGYDGTD